MLTTTQQPENKLDNHQSTYNGYKTIATTIDFPILFCIMINSQVKNIKRNMVNKRKFLIEYMMMPRFFSYLLILVLDFLRVIVVKNKRISRQNNREKKMRKRLFFL